MTRLEFILLAFCAAVVGAAAWAAKRYGKPPDRHPVPPVTSTPGCCIEVRDHLIRLRGDECGGWRPALAFEECAP